MHLEFYGAAEEVTGSLHRVHVNGKDVLLDCGLNQGRRAEANERNRVLPAWALSAHALVLSHAYIDHSGNIPSVVKAGFTGNIYCTPCTRDLCSVMLRDSATIQQQDIGRGIAKLLGSSLLRRMADISVIDDLLRIEVTVRSAACRSSWPPPVRAP